jgi:hypothetical protein
VLVGAATVVALAVVLALAPRSAPSEPLPAPGALAIDGGTRAAFVRHLGAGDPAGLAAYFAQDVPSSWFTATAEVLERSGVGPATIRLRPRRAPEERNRATVLLVAQTDAHAGWTVRSSRPVLRADDPLNLLDRRVGDLHAGIPAFSNFTYGRPSEPVELRIAVPKGVRWGAAVILMEG